MQKAILGIDCDGVLADFNQAYIDLIIKESGKDLFPPQAADRPDYPDCWEYPEERGYDKTWISQHIWKICIEQDPLFWKRLEPMPGLIRTLIRLNKLRAQGHDVYFLTNRMGQKAKLQTELWLRQWGMVCPTVILVADKAPVVEALGITVFVDDKLRTVNDVKSHAEFYNLPVDGHVYLKDAPYNREGRRKGLIVVNNVLEVLDKEGLG